MFRVRVWDRIFFWSPFGKLIIVIKCMMCFESVKLLKVFCDGYRFGGRGYIRLKYSLYSIKIMSKQSPYKTPLSLSLFLSLSVCVCVCV